jgi:hypothetical protein
MPATSTQVMDGLKARLATVSGLRTFDYQPEQVNPPLAFPSITGINYYNAFRGGDVQFTVDITVVLGRYTDRVTFARLDEFTSFSGASSIRAALEGDSTLGGVCSDLIVESASAVGSLAVDGAEFLAVTFAVTVHG